MDGRRRKSGPYLPACDSKTTDKPDYHVLIGDRHTRRGTASLERRGRV